MGTCSGNSASQGVHRLPSFPDSGRGPSTPLGGSRAIGCHRCLRRGEGCTAPRTQPEPLPASGQAGIVGVGVSACPGLGGFRGRADTSRADRDIQVDPGLSLSIERALCFLAGWRCLAPSRLCCLSWELDVLEIAHLPIRWLAGGGDSGRLRALDLLPPQGDIQAQHILAAGGQ